MVDTYNVAEWIVERARLEEEITTLRAEIEAKDAEIAQLHVANDSAHKACDAEQERADALERELAEAKKDSARLVEAMKQACRVSTNGKLSADLLAAIDRYSVRWSK